MKKIYQILLDGKVIGTTQLEKADPPMGTVWGKIVDGANSVNYAFIKSYCKEKGIDLAGDFPEDRFISTRTIKQLQIISPDGISVQGEGNQISGMDAEEFEVYIEGIDYPFYGEEFPHHVKEYEDF
ncbi:MAG: hypothetical protein AAGC85_10395 [Bacteroidota bacterium]